LLFFSVLKVSFAFCRFWNESCVLNLRQEQEQDLVVCGWGHGVGLKWRRRGREWKEGGHEGLLVCSSMSKQSIMLAHWIADKEALMFTLVSKQGTGIIFQVGGSLPPGWTDPEQVRSAGSFDLWRRKLEKSRLST
jgi:hypothetical protein